jgi:hypothetical protein
MIVYASGVSLNERLVLRHRPPVVDDRHLAVGHAGVVFEHARAVKNHLPKVIDPMCFVLIYARHGFDYALRRRMLGHVLFGPPAIDTAFHAG